MPKLPVVSGLDIVKVLSKLGFKHVRTKGSHMILVNDSGSRKIMIPVPNHKELAKGTLKSIMNQANLELDKLLEFL